MSGFVNSGSCAASCVDSGSCAASCVDSGSCAAGCVDSGSCAGSRGGSSDNFELGMSISVPSISSTC